MRVISGTARGINLISLKGQATRPTLDRIKESLFDILQFDIKNAIILDLFSGSGALAIEALSRGANQAVINDNSTEAIKIINCNLEHTKLKDKSILINSDYLQVLDKLKRDSKKFDIIFLDPPYKSNYILISINKIIENDLLKKDGIIIVETNDKNKIDAITTIKNIEIYDIRKYGIVFLIFIRKG